MAGCTVCCAKTLWDVVINYDNIAHCAGIYNTPRYSDNIITNTLEIRQEPMVTTNLLFKLLANALALGELAVE